MRTEFVTQLDYLALMAITAVTTFFVRSIRHRSLSPVHLVIPLTLVGVIGALLSARHGNLRAHRNAMLGLYFGGILLAGAFAFIPGRLLHQVLFEASR